MSHPHTEHLNRAAPGGQTHRGKQQRLWARQRRPRGRAARSMLTTNPTLLIKPDWARTSGESSACTAARLAKACPAPSATRTSRRAPHCAATSHCPAGSANSHSRSRPCGPARRLLSRQAHWLALAAPPRLPSRASCQCSHHRAPARSAYPAQIARRSARQPHFNMTRRASWQHLRDDEDGAVAGRGGRLRGRHVQAARRARCCRPCRSPLLHLATGRRRTSQYARSRPRHRCQQDAPYRRPPPPLQQRRRNWQHARLQQGPLPRRPPPLSPSLRRSRRRSAPQQRRRPVNRAGPRLLCSRWHPARPGPPRHSACPGGRSPRRRLQR